MEIFDNITTLLSLGCILSIFGIILPSMVSRGVQMIIGWIKDNDQAMFEPNYFEKKIEAVTGFEAPILGIMAIMAPVLIYIALILYPLTLAVASGYAMMHLARFAYRLSTKLGVHVEDKDAHNSGDE